MRVSVGITGLMMTAAAAAAPAGGLVDRLVRPPSLALGPRAALPNHQGAGLGPFLVRRRRSLRSLQGGSSNGTNQTAAPSFDEFCSTYVPVLEFWSFMTLECACLSGTRTVHCETPKPVCDKSGFCTSMIFEQTASEDLTYFEDEVQCLNFTGNNASGPYRDGCQTASYALVPNQTLPTYQVVSCTATFANLQGVQTKCTTCGGCMDDESGQFGLEVDCSNVYPNATTDGCIPKTGEFDPTAQIMGGKVYGIFPVASYAPGGGGSGRRRSLQDASNQTAEDVANNITFDEACNAELAPSYEFVSFRTLTCDCLSETRTLLCETPEPVCDGSGFCTSMINEMAHLSDDYTSPGQGSFCLNFSGNNASGPYRDGCISYVFGNSTVEPFSCVATFANLQGVQTNCTTCRSCTTASGQGGAEVNCSNVYPGAATDGCIRLSLKDDPTALIQGGRFLGIFPVTSYAADQGQGSGGGGGSSGAPSAWATSLAGSTIRTVVALLSVLVAATAM
jgi:hypothetical protein